MKRWSGKPGRSQREDRVKWLGRPHTHPEGAVTEVRNAALTSLLHPSLALPSTCLQNMDGTKILNSGLAFKAVLRDDEGLAVRQ